MITEEEVIHIANLAKLNIKPDEMIKYRKQLSDILTEIDKITDVEINETDIMISPSEHKNIYFNDEIGFQINKDLAFKNAKNIKGDYIVVPKVIE